MSILTNSNLQHKYYILLSQLGYFNIRHTFSTYTDKVKAWRSYAVIAIAKERSLYSAKLEITTRIKYLGWAIAQVF